MNRDNLEKLATYLEGLPADYRHFSMWSYLAKDEEIVDYPANDEEIMVGDCGTVACAVGHGPAAGLPAKPGEDWDGYEQRVFGISSAQWYWCFSSCWGWVDNTPHGAAKRIRYMLEHGLPANAFEQQSGDAPYMFGEPGAEA